MKTILRKVGKFAVALQLLFIATPGSSQVFTASVPLGWKAEKIGTDETEGQKATETNGVFTLISAGSDVGYGANDQFVYVYKKLHGDGTIIAKVESQTITGTIDPNTSAWAKSGVMIREDNYEKAKFALIAMSGANGPLYEVRIEKDANELQTLNDVSLTGTLLPPYWVKLVRIGDDFDAFTSSDGVTWDEIAPAYNNPMNTDVLIGIMKTSHASGVLGSTEISHVSLEGSITDIGVGLSHKELGGEGLSVYPNPSKGDTRVSFNAAQKSTYKLDVRNVLGQVVYQRTLTDFSGSYNRPLELSQYGKGLYTVTLSNGGKSTMKKAVVY